MRAGCCFYARLSELEVVDAVFEDRLELIARNVLGDVRADAFAVAHFAEDAAVWAGEPFDGGVGAVDIVRHIETGIAVKINVLGDHLIVREEMLQRFFSGDEATFAVGERDLVGGADFHACEPWRLVAHELGEGVLGLVTPDGVEGEGAVVFSWIDDLSVW